MKLEERLGIDLNDINDALLDVIQSDNDLPKPSIAYDNIVSLIQAGGKRLRPMLVIVGSRFGPACADRAIFVTRVAAMLEYLHMASLIHDDIIDQAELRRGEATIHIKTDIHTAVLIANYMMVRAVEWAVSDNGHAGRGESSSEQAGRCAELASMITELCGGEYSQLRHRFHFDMTIDSYLHKTYNKTALLMANCLKAGAEASGASPDASAALYEFGEALGMAFQINDDLLDFTQTTAIIGKPAGLDLRAGNVTLPVLYALEDPELAPLIRSLHAGSPNEAFERIIACIADNDAMTRARQLSLAYVQQARSSMQRLNGHPAAADLLALLDYFI